MPGVADVAAHPYLFALHSLLTAPQGPEEPVMLPDFRAVKRALAGRAADTIMQRVHGDPLLGLIGSQRVHEGNQLTVFRADGSHETSSYRVLHSEVELDPKKLKSPDSGALQDAIGQLADQITAGTSTALIKTVEEAVDAVGNAVSAGGKPFTAELWIQALEKIEFSFRTDGSWEPPTLVIHPSMEPRVEAELQRLESDEELKDRLDALIATKRAEWRDRESRRKLVD